MAAYSPTALRTSLPFVITPHVAEDGVFEAVLPDEGPCRDRDGEPCSLGVHHLRPRKTGPCFPLTVMRCRTHGLAFTLYPPGHVPYGRQAIAPVALDGSDERLVPVDEAQPLERWESTIFRAALDAARAEAWPRAPEPPEPACWRTQGRHLLRVLRLLGLAPEQDSRRDIHARALRVDTQLLRDHARLLGSGVGYREHGRAATAVLAEVERSGCVLDSTQRAGELASLWGRPLTWDRGTCVLREPSFPSFPARPP